MDFNTYIALSVCIGFFSGVIAMWSECPAEYTPEKFDKAANTSCIFALLMLIGWPIFLPVLLMIFLGTMLKYNDKK